MTQARGGCMKTKQWIRFVLAGMVLMLGCNSNDLTKSASPVALIVSNTMTFKQVDIAGGAGCGLDWGAIQMQAVDKNTWHGPVTPPVGPPPNTTFNQVRVTRYQVSYQRTDGGKLVPAPYVRSMDTLLQVGGSPIPITPIALFNTVAVYQQAPFAALFPNNGGIDPDTGKAFVQMDIIVDVFGQTLAGESVSGSTRFPMDFCYNCNGCS
jgi:hypothetical protein